MFLKAYIYTACFIISMISDINVDNNIPKSRQELEI